MTKAAGPSMSDTVASDLPALLAEQRIRRNSMPRECRLSIIRPPARHRSLIVFLFVFNLIWTTAAVFLVKQDAPLVFQIVWPLSAGVIWLSIFWQLLYKRTATFTRDGLRLRHQLGPVSREEVIEKSQITGFSHDTNMSSNNVSFYRVRLENVLGKKKTVADGINRSTTAEALVQSASSLEEIRVNQFAAGAFFSSHSLRAARFSFISLTRKRSLSYWS